MADYSATTHKSPVGRHPLRVLFNATLFAIEAQIGDRSLHAKAAPRQVARMTYEASLEGGQAAALHEELPRGVCMVFAVPLAPSAEIE